MMKQAPTITCLFLDIGGVPLTNGWNHHAHQRAPTGLKLDWAGDCRVMGTPAMKPADPRVPRQVCRLTCAVPSVAYLLLLFGGRACHDE